MGPLDALRRTEQQIQEAARHGAEVAKTTLHSVEAQMRRHMHMSVKQSVPDDQPSQEPKARTGIVSVNGHDVERMRCTGGRNSI